MHKSSLDPSSAKVRQKEAFLRPGQGDEKVITVLTQLAQKDEHIFDPLFPDE
jgi:hypothetical protein